jgi:superfamily I DNA/RNA helicase
MSTPTIAFGQEFLTAFSRIDRKAQRGVRTTINELQNDPNHPGLNFEPIHQAADKNLFSIRIDKNYRGILLWKQSQQVYVLLWVDKHDDAYDWACRRRCIINQETGALQVVPVKQEEEAGQVAHAKPAKEGIFANLRDRELKKLGVPEELLEDVKAIQDEADLDRNADSLPGEVSEALYMLAAGYSIEEAYNELDKDVPAKVVSDDDFKAALEHPDTMRRFHIVEDAEEMEAMLNAPLEQWRVFLHPSQRKIVKIDANGPVRVLGGAGTGKTVVAMHRAKYLLEKVFWKKNDRILFLTYTKNLTEDIRQNLSTILHPEDIKRVEVVNLDQWVGEYLKGNGYASRVVYGDETEGLWKSALEHKPTEPDLPDTFYIEEWDEVIQAQGIMTEADFIRAPRLGRGRRLDRRGRKAVWVVFQEFRRLLDSKGYKESDDAYRDATALLEASPGRLPYKSVIVDESQDLGTQAFKLIRSIVPKPEDENRKNDIFLVGDARQRIYGKKVILSQCGIEIRGRSRNLRINYRTTEETRAWAFKILEGKDFDDLDGGVDDQKGYRSLMHGPEPKIQGFPDLQAEIDYILAQIQQLTDSGVEPSSICVVTRTQTVLDKYLEPAKAAYIATFKISRKDSRTSKGIRFATMHRVKGIEFDHIFIPGARKDTLPLAHALRGCDNEVSRANAEKAERSLLYVAATRAKKSVVVTYSGNPSPFIV